jgi:phosphopantothenoylcysteine synthetase/decarboxylase
MLKVLVTAGGTFEPLDSVRGLETGGLTNVSTGALGHAIVREAVGRGAHVHFIVRDAVLKRDQLPNQGVEYGLFSSFRDLHRRLNEDVPRYRPDIIFMAAAPADYSPYSIDGKLPSDAEELLIRCRRNPKLLPTLRDLADEGCLIVGFKLLSGVSEDTLIETARHQIAEFRTDACVANDIASIDSATGAHPLTLVWRSGAVQSFEGLKSQVAGLLVNAVFKRHQTR